jgi:hypothetical protein
VSRPRAKWNPETSRKSALCQSGAEDFSSRSYCIKAKDATPPAEHMSPERLHRTDSCEYASSSLWWRPKSLKKTCSSATQNAVLPYVLRADFLLFSRVISIPDRGKEIFIANIPAEFYVLMRLGFDSLQGAIKEHIARFDRSASQRSRWTLEVRFGNHPFLPSQNRPAAAKHTRTGTGATVDTRV